MSAGAALAAADVVKPADEVLVRCQNLVVGRSGRPLLPAFDLELRRGEFLVVVGRNGAGKSTWFRTVLGFLPPISGTVVRSQPHLRLAYGAQSIALDRTLPMRARDVVGWGRQNGWRMLWPFHRDPDRGRCDQALHDAGADTLGDLPFRDLSEGQKQRVLLARILAAEPDVALLDEPTSSMDMIAERETMSLLCRLTRERRMATVVVSHFIGVAAEHANKVAFFDRDDDVVVVGPPTVVFADPAFRRHFGVVEPRHTD